MNNKQLYKDTFDHFKLSEEAIRKVKDMSEKNKKKSSWTRFGAAAAVVVLVIALGNVTAYAATGSVPVAKMVDKVIERVSVYINGEKADDKMINTYVDKDGNTHIEMEVDPDVNTSIEADYQTLEDENMSMSVVSDTQSDKGTAETTVEIVSGTLKQKGDKTFLIIGDNHKSIDITKDFSDGSAKGTVEIDDIKYQYSVTGTIKEHKISITRG